jgi:hypothetical protein
LLSTALAAASQAESELCASWTGEIEPLPTVSDPDPLLAAWAELRADQLAEVALLLELRSRVLAHRVWRHASCLDPERLELLHGLARTTPVRWFRPPILGVDESGVSEGEEISGPGSERSGELGEPIRVVLARTPAPESLPPALDLTEQIAAAEKALREARFELALEWVERGRRLLGSEGPTRERPGQRAQLEVLAATAEIALGREDEARESLERALRAQAGLSLDPAVHSPKVVQLFESVRGGDGPAP